MVTITNGVKVFRVPSGAVKQYKSMGFHTVSDEELEAMKQAEQEHFDDAGEPVNDKGSIPSGENPEEEESDGEEEHEDDISAEDKAFVEEILEKPLSQWSTDEMKDFVRIKGIDTSSAQKASQVRGIIKSYLEEEQKKNA